MSLNQDRSNQSPFNKNNKKDLIAVSSVGKVATLYLLSYKSLQMSLCFKMILKCLVLVPILVHKWRESL
jgi:hypothetical protein